MLMNVQLLMVLHDARQRLRNVSIRSVHIDVTVLTAFSGEVANVKQKTNVRNCFKLQLKCTTLFRSGFKIITLPV